MEPLLRPKLLDCTLRDGSYAIDFQFTVDFTRTLCQELDLLGFDYIEIGHGIGIGADKKYRPAIATDLQYGEAASSVVQNSLWGMFAQPHISTAQDIKNLHDLGMGFIRIGIDVDNISQGIDLAWACYEMGLEVFLNLMKSYRLPYQELQSLFEQLSDAYFLSGLYLVDSAGGMLSSQVEILSKQMYENVSKNIMLGFHGHDNLGMALSHSLLVLKNGFRVIDCTLQGIGRSSGNTSSEKLISLMKREGIRTIIDPIDAMKVSETRIRPLLPRAGHAGLDTMAGFSLFHTSYMDELIEISARNRVDPYHLMLAIGSNSISEMNLETIIASLLSQNKILSHPIPTDKYPGHEQDF
jgi:4-hydroxy-2-oxovalerate aldolase